DLLFLLVLFLAYVLVTRRRARILVVVDHLEAAARQGLPLHSTLRALGRDLKGFLGTRLADIARKVEDGATLREALAFYPHTFPPVLRTMAALGEESGNLAGFLSETRRSYRRLVEFASQSVYFYLYPILLSLLITGVLSAFGGFIIPKFEEVFSQVGIPYPGYLGIWIQIATQIVLILSVLLAFFVFFGQFPFHFGISPLRMVKGLIDHVVLGIPVLGRMVRDRTLHAFAAGTGLLVRAGASVPEAVRIAAEAEENQVFRRRFERMAKRLEEGGRLGALCREDRLFPDYFVWFVETGESSGALPEHLMQAAAHSDARARFFAQMASRSVVPLFVALNGMLVLSTMLFVMLPMSNLLEGIVPW
ncbi:MAG: type II secretion system F family protein, partial [Planctomycetota bacterium]